MMLNYIQEYATSIETSVVMTDLQLKIEDTQTWDLWAWLEVLPFPTSHGRHPQASLFLEVSHHELQFTLIVYALTSIPFSDVINA